MAWKPISRKAKAARGAMMSEAEWGARHENAIHYSQSESRDNWLKGSPRSHMHLPAALDCSSWATYLIWRATGGDSALDPSGYHFNGVGNSTSIAAHAHQVHNVVGLYSARRGDLVVWSGKHVSILTQSPHRIFRRNPHIIRLGTDAHASSHGSEAGPYSVSVKDEIAGLGKPIYVKSIPDKY